MATKRKDVENDSKDKGAPGWGELNKALNGLVRTGTILRYTTARPESGSPVSVEVAIPNGADQAEVVRDVREALPQAFSGATVRTREA